MLVLDRMVTHLHSLLPNLILSENFFLRPTPYNWEKKSRYQFYAAIDAKDIFFCFNPITFILNIKLKNYLI